MRRGFSYLLGAVITMASPSVAMAAEFVNSGSVGGIGSYNLSITTDDTIGVIQSLNILAYNIFVSNGTNDFTLTQSNSTTLFSGMGLTATATDLLFNFSGSGFALFQSPMVGSGGPFFCFQASPCFDFAGSGTGLAPVVANSPIGNRLQGTQIVATVAAAGAVPEPSTWAMMLIGFGFVGYGMRSAKRRRKLTLTYA